MKYCISNSKYEIEFDNKKIVKILKYNEVLDEMNEKHYDDELKASMCQMYELFLSGMKLYAFTVTYTADKFDVNAQKSAKERFHHWYWHTFLPKIFYEDKSWVYEKQKKGLQPRIIVFTEKHKPKSNNNNKTGIKNPERLHHHGIMAVDPQFEEKLDSFIGENTLNKICTGVMTTDFKKCDIFWMLYAGEEHKPSKYPLLVYGPM